MKPGKIFLVSFSGKSQAGGVERVVYHLDEYFHHKGMRTMLIDETFLVKHTLLGRLFNLLFRHHHFRKRKEVYMARYTSAYLWLHKRRNDIVITQGESAPFFPVDVNFIHGCYHLMEKAYWRKEEHLSRISRLQQRNCLSARQVVAVSSRVKQDIVRWYEVPEEKIAVLNNCVDTNRFRPYEKKYSHQRTVLFVGRLISYKGLDILEQLATTIEQSDNWRLLIACNETPDTARFSGFSRTTIKTGLNIDNIATGAYAAADLLILPSMFEGFELVTLEALSTGIPVIGTKVGAISELSDEGFPGVYVLPGHISCADDAILRHFEQLLADFQRTITPQALHEKIAARFGLERYTRELDTILSFHN